MTAVYVVNVFPLYSSSPFQPYSGYSVFKVSLFLRPARSPYLDSKILKLSIQKIRHKGSIFNRIARKEINTSEEKIAKGDKQAPLALTRLLGLNIRPRVRYERIREEWQK